MLFFLVCYALLSHETIKHAQNTSYHLVSGLAQRGSRLFGLRFGETAWLSGAAEHKSSAGTRC